VQHARRTVRSIYSCAWSGRGIGGRCGPNVRARHRQTPPSPPPIQLLQKTVAHPPAPAKTIPLARPIHIVSSAMWDIRCVLRVPSAPSLRWDRG
jgi:hypothetical protein